MATVTATATVLRNGNVGESGILCFRMLTCLGHFILRSTYARSGICSRRLLHKYLDKYSISYAYTTHFELTKCYIGQKRNTERNTDQYKYLSMPAPRSIKSLSSSVKSLTSQRTKSHFAMISIESSIGSSHKTPSPCVGFQESFLSFV